MSNTKSPKKADLPTPAALLPDVVAAVLAAGEMIRAEFHLPGGPRGGHGKAAVDVEVEAFLQRRLTELHGCDWRGEELARRLSGHADVWMVDPQDGTRAFLRGCRGSAVSVGLVRNGVPVLGVVYAPTAPDDAGDLFVWAEGLVLRRNGVAVGAPRDSVADAGVRGYDHATILAMNERAGDYAAHNHALFAPAAVRAVPSISYRLALAAAGEVDAAISLTGGLDSYDIAGGHALLRAVGGCLVELDGTAMSHGGRRGFDGCIGGRPEIVEAVRLRRPGQGAAVPRNPAKPRRRSGASDALGRAQGVLAGLLAGDALGSQVEFRSPGWIARAFPKGLRDLLPGGTWDLLAGQPTDDGELALALARSLVAEGGFSERGVAAAYGAWRASRPFDIGGTTAQGIDALSGRGAPNLNSQANGALMRVAPVGIACAGDPEAAAVWARQDAGLTHPHAVCRAASAAFAAAIAAGVAGADAAEMWSVAHASAGIGAQDEAAGVIRACLEAAREAPPADFVNRQGWVLTALGNAFHRLWTGQDFASALTATVMQGGDTDTNAAICGALLGAVQGREAIPLRWRQQVLSCRAVAGRGVAHPRPATYWGDDAMELAEALLAVSRERS